MGGAPELVTVEGQRIRLTNLDKVLYPETGTTKADVLDYFARVAPVMLPHVRDRPATRKRWVHGVEGSVFFQKNLDGSTPEWVPRRTLQHSDHVNEYPLVNNLATLTWLGQIAALEIHVPQWRFGRTGARKNPDRLVLDLDPGEGAGLAECAVVARHARVILHGMGLEPMPVTSGSKGMHLYAAIDGSQTSDQVSAVAHELARALEADHPDLVVSDMKKVLRGGKVLVDWSQNNGNKTTIAPYSLRGRARPMVAAPRSWEELSSPELDHLEYHEVLRRVERDGDLLASLEAGHLASLEPTPEHLDRFEASPDARDRLELYRSKRDPAKTPEPVPSAAAPSSDGRSFVIQEHHARRLHYDLRLEHDGVLVSWAVPKGVPTDSGRNHLAVQTEDHPLEYGTFEGSIPHGEYGAGEVTIWDAGSYDLEKWREGKEVIATLHGEPGGGLGEPRRIALIHTGGEGAENNWLLHLMKDAQPGTHHRRERKATTRPPTTATAKAPVRASAMPGPMLATLGSEDDTRDGEDWAFEMKWDGFRALARVRDGQVEVRSRTGLDMTATFPELGELAGQVDGDALLDGEIVALDAKGRPSFGLMQNRMNLTRPGDVERARARTPVYLMLFDVLEHDGRSMLRAHYDERRQLLESIVTESDRIHVPPAFDGDLDAAMKASLDLGLEGVMAKRRDGVYSPGRRSRGWLKIKHLRTQEVVVAGWRPGNGRRARGVGSLLLGVPEDGELRYVGRVGTGFRDRDLDEMLDRFRGMERKTSPLTGVPAVDARDAHWITPKLVGEVRFAEWTDDHRMRQPSWRGWRNDKSPSDVSLESG